jgi:Uma2 family endonuclease
MSAIPKFTPHYTFADYSEWVGDWELWQGVPVAMSPSPFGVHQWIALQIAYQFINSLKPNCNDCYVLHEIDWIVSDDTIVRPDILIGCGPFPQRHVVEPPALIVEVLSPSTSHKDLTAKRPLYRSQKVEHYLIVDPDAKSLQWLRLDTSQPDYVLQADAPNYTIELKSRCVVNLDVPSLFPAMQNK